MRRRYTSFLRLCRYVEANAARAGLVKRAEDGSWCGLHARRHRDKPFTLTAWPVDRPRNWTATVNEPLPEEVLKAMQTSIHRGRPLGDDDWTQATARRLGLESTLRRPGRPRKDSDNE